MSRVSRGFLLSDQNIAQACEYPSHMGVRGSCQSPSQQSQSIIGGNTPAFSQATAVPGWDSTSSMRAEEDNLCGDPGEPQPFPRISRSRPVRKTRSNLLGSFAARWEIQCAQSVVDAAQKRTRTYLAANEGGHEWCQYHSLPRMPIHGLSLWDPSASCGAARAA